MKSPKLWIGLLVVFLAGLLSGVIISGLVLRHKVRGIIDGGPLVVREMLLQRLSSELKLNAEQLEQIAPIINQAHEELLKLRLRNQPEIGVIVNEALGSMLVILTPEQAQHLEEMHARFKERWEIPSLAGPTAEPEPRGPLPSPLRH
jgi:hypothetical protein